MTKQHEPEPERYKKMIKNIKVDFTRSSQTVVTPRQAYRLVEALKQEGYIYPKINTNITVFDNAPKDMFIAVINESLIVGSYDKPVDQLKNDLLPQFMKRWINL